MLTRNCKTSKKLLVLSFLFTILFLILARPALTQSQKFRTTVRETPKPPINQEQVVDVKELNARLMKIQAELERAQQTIAELKDHKSLCKQKCMSIDARH
jgi:uncharacterized small protein (DUF1192 family)